MTLSTRWSLVLGILPVLAGCPTRQGYLSSTTDAWGAEIVERAEPGIDLGLGVAAMAASLCPMERVEWLGQLKMGIALDPVVAEWLGIWLTTGQVSLDAFTGQFSVVFEGDDIMGYTGIQYEVQAITPSQNFKVEVNFTDPDSKSDATWTLADVEFITTGCQGDHRQVAGTMHFYPEGLESTSVAMPWINPEATSNFLLIPRGSVIPWGDADTGKEAEPGGQIEWTGGGPVGLATLRTDDASQIDGSVWPAAAGGTGWSTPVDLNLTEMK